MGHYDDCYEQDRIETEKRERKDNLAEVREKLKKLNSTDLAFVSSVLDYLKELKGTLEFLKENLKQG